MITKYWTSRQRKIRVTPVATGWNISISPELKRLLGIGDLEPSKCGNKPRLGQKDSRIIDTIQTFTRTGNSMALRCRAVELWYPIPRSNTTKGLDLPEWDYCSVLLIGMGGNEGVTIGTKMDSGLNKFANKNSMFRKNMLSKLLLNACLNHVACAA